jgi:hypothetical protein
MKIHTKFYSESLKVERPYGRPRHRWKDDIKTDLKWGMRM